MRRINNHRRKLSSFDEQLAIVRKHGFNPIAVTQMLLEDTFVFGTTAEAKVAYETLESGPVSLLQGWWYGYSDFLKAVEQYESDNLRSKVKIFWLDQ